MLTYIKTIILISVPFFLHLNGFAQDTLTLERAIDIAMENNYQMKVARNNTEIAENNVSVGNAGFLPDFSLNAGANYESQNSDLQFADGSGQQRNWAKSQSYNASLDMEYTLFDGLQRFTNYDILSENRRMEQARLEQEKLNIKAEVARVYFQVVLEKDQKNVIEKSLNLSRQRLNFAENKYNLGRFSRSEYLSARVDYNEDTAAYLRAQNNLEQAKIQLNELLERDPSTSYTVAEELPIPESTQLGTLRETMLSTNPVLQEARSARYRAEKEKTLEKNAFLPSLSLNAAYNYSYSQAEAGFVLNSQNDGPSVGFTFSFPLFQGMNQSRRLQNAKIQLQSQEWRVAELNNELTAQLARQHTSFNNRLNLAQLEKDNVSIARENEALTLEQYQEGAVDALTFREAQQNAIDTEGRYLEALYQTHLALIEIKKLTGDF